MTCSLIIRAFNEERHIGRLIDGISKQRLPPHWRVEVILVDSGSTDSTVSIAEQMGARIVRIHKNDFSFGRALNRGCAEANGEVLIFASAHVYPVYVDWIHRLASGLQDPEVALVYGRQIGNEVTKFSEHQVFAQWFPDSSHARQNHPFCNNANCAIKKSVWQTQNYDERLTGLEDLDWAKRVMAQGYSISYDAEATVVHVHEESYRKIRHRYQREAIAMKEIVPTIHFSFFEMSRLVLVSSLKDYVKALKQGRLFRELLSVPKFRFMQYYGTWLGHTQRGKVSSDLKNRFYYPHSGTGEPGTESDAARKVIYSKPSIGRNSESNKVDKVAN